MNKKYISLALAILFMGAIAFIVVRYEVKNKPVAFYPLMERKGPGALSAEWASTKSTGEKLIRMVRDNPDDLKSRIALATLYAREARITGNYMYYDGAALRYINEVLAKDPNHFEALTLKAMLYLSQHHFSDGLVLAQQAQQTNPYNAFVYGLLVDANVELGNYPEAVKNSDQMVSIRPDIRSYSRISYLREIHGDYPGAIDAMKMAVEAGGYGDEATEWARIQLARLYENTGDRKAAEMHYTIALDERPGYAYAVAGLAHLAMASKDYKKAIALYEQADNTVSDYSFKEQLAQVYFAMGDREKGEELIHTIIEAMSRDAQKGEQDNKVGHYADRELANAYVLINDYDKALQHALAEYHRRPQNIDVNETMAWVYYKMGDAQKAVPYIDVALRTHCQNPTLLCHAGLIYTKAGDAHKAKELLQEALKNNPSIEVDLKEESGNTLKTL
jgi:tetratricopeptide (TPR) repeat protein